jgi:sulfatase modifying factor 1
MLYRIAVWHTSRTISHILHGIRGGSHRHRAIGETVTMSSCCGPSRPNSGDAVRAGSRSVGGGRADSATGRPKLDLVAIPGGDFTMGTNDPQGYPADGEGPEHRVTLGSFSISAHAITNDDFAGFVDATGHRTTAERFGNSFVFGRLLPDEFPDTRGVAAAPWWREVFGADWRHPEGPQSDIDARGDHPVVHVSWLDAAAFCEWSGTRLPTEAEWEYAARGGWDAVHYPWGDEREPDGVHRMNVFQGDFPGQDTGDDGFVGTCPVASFPANAYGLYEVTGNVWEWCADWYDPNYYSRSPRSNPTGPTDGQARVMRGGSYLCHESYCWRYRVDARSANTPDSTAGNLGFRVAS